ncbi:hypothetical protein ACWGQT_07395 [Streptomyces yangpuensis]
MSRVCPATSALAPQEAERLAALPGIVMDADTEPYHCDYAQHGPDVRHTACVLEQEVDGRSVLWWLVWGNEGQRDVVAAPGCRKIVRNETCLLIKGHPGDCDQEIGFTREELRGGLR